MAQQVVTAKDVMSGRMVFIDGMATIAEAASKMKEQDVTALLVEKRTPEDAWAIISVKDIVRGAIGESRQLSDVDVYEVMTKPVLAVPADMDVRYVARLLNKLGISRAPVDKNGELLGMITLADIVMHFVVDQ